MKALALFLAIAPALQSAPQSGSATPVEARLVIEPESVAVGEPAELRLVVSHPGALRVRLVEDTLALDDTWVVFDASGRSTRPDPDRPGRARTTARWTIASLEPGTRELPAVPVDYDWNDVPRRLFAAGPVLGVRGVLGAGEDGPRPPRGFRDVADPPLPSGIRALWALAALVGAGLAALLLRRWRRRRAARAPEPGPAPLAVLESLGTAPPEGSEELRDAHYEITRQVRRAAGVRLDPEPAAGSTDLEWLAAIERSGLPAEVRAELTEIVRSCGEVKYGGARPTPFALRETLDRARRVVGALAHGESGGPAR